MVRTGNDEWVDCSSPSEIGLDKATEKTDPTQSSCHWFVIDWLMCVCLWFVVHRPSGGVSMKWMMGAMLNAMNRRRGKGGGAKIDAKMRIFFPSSGLWCTV